MKTGINILQLSSRLGKVLAKLCKHFSNEKKKFPKTENILCKSRQKPENFHLGSLKDLGEALELDSGKSYLRK